MDEHRFLDLKKGNFLQHADSFTDIAENTLTILVSILMSYLIKQSNIIIIIYIFSSMVST